MYGRPGSRAGHQIWSREIRGPVSGHDYRSGFGREALGRTIFILPGESYYLENLKTKLDISLQKHHSVGVIVHGHEDCAGHPVENQQHKKDILVAAYRLQALLGNAIKVIPVFVRKVGEEWMVETLVEMTESL